MLLKRRRRIEEDEAFERGQAELVKRTADMIQSKIDNKISEKFHEVIQNNVQAQRKLLGDWQMKAMNLAAPAGKGEAVLEGIDSKKEPLLKELANK